MFFKIHSIVLQKYVQKITNINTKNASIFNFFKQTERKIHFYNKTHQKLRYEYENNHVYSIMQSIPIYENTLSISLSNKLENELINHENFEKFLRKNWRQESATNITNMFKKLCYYAQLNNISLSDKRFDSLVDGLMDNCRNLTDDELSELLYCVNEYPKPESPTDHNFHDIWSALDDICCARINLWSIQKTLLFTDHWYRIGLAKYVDFTIQAIKKYCRKISKLSAAELVQVLFYINVCRKQWTMFDFEVRVGECINDLTLDELAIVSMAFFKTESTIKDTFILSQMLKRLLQETSSVHEITLTAILKVSNLLILTVKINVTSLILTVKKMAYVAIFSNFEFFEVKHINLFLDNPLFTSFTSSRSNQRIINKTCPRNRSFIHFMLCSYRVTRYKHPTFSSRSTFKNFRKICSKYVSLSAKRFGTNCFRPNFV